MNRVLVARLDSLGDVLLAGPAVRAVAARHRVTMLCSQQGAPAAGLLPGVAQVLTWQCPWIVNPSPAVRAEDLEDLVTRIGSHRFDEAVILTSFHQSPLPLALALRLAGVPRVTGASVDYAGSLLDIRLRPGEDFPEDEPEPVRALTIAAAAGHRLPPDDEGHLAVRPTAEPARWVGEGHYVVVHPGASAAARTWPAQNHGELVSLLAAEGRKVVVTGGPGETSLTASVAGRAGLDLGGRLDLPQLAAVLAGADAVVVGNTGPAHLAAAVGTPVVSLFSPVVPAVRWAPYGVPVELLGDQDAPCRGSRARECPIPGHPCLSEVTAHQALAAVHRLIGPGPRSPMTDPDSLAGAR
ncbi:ADP-heptose:LPS heptosyltransferase [Propionibacterium cyclohexanicum]|uniref:ADP-heptose:LPS heptosyltransferase n=1 Tax=Propionibacterium cyclohexanicum TaxID=64702 RepID=A0A1H9SGS9_9ACTN|nr:glycosyltransferase family 9 protein [Propionibacterium cyclohexanicum]SER84246.1 ADP-heptose:LPS heptosyltransferase [Propionibacterium cyclohexanicum]